MKQYTYTGLFILSDNSKFELQVSASSVFSAFFLLTAEAIRQGRYFQLHTIYDIEHGTVFRVGDIRKCNELLLEFHPGSEKTGYTLGDDTINGIEINERIPDEDLFEYRITHRGSFIEELMSWIPGATEDKELMKQDLKMLMNLDDEYIFSSISTNKYIYQGHPDFETTCQELLELNKTL